MYPYFPSWYFLSILYSYNSREREDHLSLGNTHYESIPHFVTILLWLETESIYSKRRPGTSCEAQIRTQNSLAPAYQFIRHREPYFKMLLVNIIPKIRNHSCLGWTMEKKLRRIRNVTTGWLLHWNSVWHSIRMWHGINVGYENKNKRNNLNDKV